MRIAAPDRVRTCRKYLASVLAPVGTTGAKHVVSYQVFIIVFVSTHVVGDEFHVGLSEVLRFVPQTCADGKAT